MGQRHDKNRFYGIGPRLSQRERRLDLSTPFSTLSPSASFRKKSSIFSTEPKSRVGKTSLRNDSGLKNKNQYFLLNTLHVVELFNKRRWRLVSAQQLSCRVYEMPRQLCMKNNHQIYLTIGHLLLAASLPALALSSLYLIPHFDGNIFSSTGIRTHGNWWKLPLR